MKKMLYLLSVFGNFIKEKKSYILAPLLITLALLSILVYYIGPAVIISFMYAGL